MKRIFVFDLDDTLGWKSPPFPLISESNVAGLRELNKDPDNLLCIATSRPRSLSAQGLQHGGMSPEEMASVFRVGVYEDGFFVQADGNTVYNALDHVDPAFLDLRKIFFDKQTVDFFRQNGYLIVPGKDVKVDGDRLVLEDYRGSVIGPLDVDPGLTVLYEQNNDVKAVYKMPKGFMGDDLDKQEPVFREIGELVEKNLDSRHPGWNGFAQIVVWQDAIDLYPKLKEEEIYLKGHGLEIAFSRFDVPGNAEVYICCDGKNDIAMVRWAMERFRNCTVVCPSNLGSDLRNYLEKENVDHRILEQDCERFIDGLKMVMGE